MRDAPPDRVTFEGPVTGIGADAARILRTLPGWFGVEASLVEYVADTERFPTFVARADGIVGFVTVREHFAESWEVHCVAVDAGARGRGIGRALHRHVEGWLAQRGVRILQVKTLAASHRSPEYAETRAFYARIGYSPVEVFPLLWRPEHPVLQLVKVL